MMHPIAFHHHPEKLESFDNGFKERQKPKSVAIFSLFTSNFMQISGKIIEQSLRCVKTD